MDVEMKNLGLTLIIGLLISQNLMATEPDWTDYAKVLQLVQNSERHNVSVTLMDYNRLKQSALLDRVTQQITDFPLKSLSSREETLAFYINTYNILALKMVLDHWPLKGIKDIGSWFNPVWKKEAGMIGGKAVSLDDIENRVLRPLKEPRIHFAIVCASISCPDLRAEPYTAKNLDQQLTAQTESFLNNAQKGVLVDGKGVRISKIFKWFKEDFKAVGGVETFMMTYRKDLPQSFTIEGYIDYDWSINALSQ